MLSLDINLKSHKKVILATIPLECYGLFRYDWDNLIAISHKLKWIQTLEFVKKNKNTYTETNDKDNPLK